MKTFPETLYVKQEEFEDEVFYVPVENIEEVAEIEEEVEVGIYKLVQVKTVTTEIKIE